MNFTDVIKGIAKNTTGIPRDYYGAYKGQPIIDANGNFDFLKGIDLFVKDGWTTRKPYTESTPMVEVLNPYMDSGITFINNPVMKGYSIGIQNTENVHKPDMTWSGLTWGASIQEIEKVYGKSISNEHETYATKYEFTIQGGMRLTMYIGHDNQRNPGLNQVFINWK